VCLLSRSTFSPFYSHPHCQEDVLHGRAGHGTIESTVGLEDGTFGFFLGVLIEERRRFLADAALTSECLDLFPGEIYRRSVLTSVIQFPVTFPSRWIGSVSSVTRDRRPDLRPRADWVLYPSTRARPAVQLSSGRTSQLCTYCPPDCGVRAGLSSLTCDVLVAGCFSCRVHVLFS